MNRRTKGPVREIKTHFISVILFVHFVLLGALQKAFGTLFILTCVLGLPVEKNSDQQELCVFLSAQEHFHNDSCCCFASLTSNW